MAKLCNSTWLSAALICLSVGSAVRADDAADEKLFEKVMGRLLSTDVTERDYPSKYFWPPKYQIMPKSEKIVNAFATASPFMGASVEEKSKKMRPIVMATTGLLREVVKGDENSLAVIMGHELAHLARDHVGGVKGDTPLVSLAFNRDQEIEADLDGLRYAIAAGYPYKTGVASAYGAMRRLDRGATSFEGLSQTHPTWEERLVFLDRNQSKLWSAMSAFQNGFMFLNLEQPLAAQQCFKAVVEEFPDCYEAWANLGHSQLMRYCDGLDADDVKTFGIGPIAGGGFYDRPDSMENKVRGIDEKLWKEAVKSLEKALALKPEQTLPSAGLGLAYLVHPEGKKLKTASKYFKDALEQIDKDPGLKNNPLAKASVFNNAGVADLAAGDLGAAKKKFEAADRFLDDVRFSPLVRSVGDVLLGNLALLDAQATDKKVRLEACKNLEVYLEFTSPDSAWWPLLFDQYAKTAKETGFKAKSRAELAQRKGPSFVRLVVSVNVGAQAIALSQPIKEAVERLGKDAVAQPLFVGSKIVRWRSAQTGIDLLGKEKILAIFLTNSKAPTVSLRAGGLSTKGHDLRVGMAEKEAMDILKDQRAQKGTELIADTKTDFQFYPEIGLGIRFAGDKVEELVIAQIPRRSFFGN